MSFNLEGKVQSGGTGRDIEELDDANVQLFEATTTGPRFLGGSQTNRNGNFEIQSPIEKTNSVFYAIARTSHGQLLMTLIGPELPNNDITINELTTVAAVYACAQFLDGNTGAVSGDPLALQIAAKMSANVADVHEGESSDLLSHSPNGDETNTLRLTRSLANLLASCIREPESCPTLMQITTLPGGTPPANTIGALLNIAKNPAYHVIDVFNRSRSQRAYEPPLETPPDAWTIAVKVNFTGDNQHMFAGPGNVVFDSKGRAWITNNVVQGTPHSTEWAVLLDAGGHPATDSTGRRISPFRGGGVLGGGFGVVVNPDDTVWLGNFGWGGEEWYPHPAGSVSLFSPNVTPISPDVTGYQSGTARVQGMVRDNLGNLWVASFGNNSVVVFIDGNPDTYAVWTGHETFFSFGIAIASDNTAWVTSSDPAGSIVHLQLNAGTTPPTLTKVGEKIIGSENKGILIDSAQNIWVSAGAPYTSEGNGAIHILDQNGNVKRVVKGAGGLDGPWGICFDGAENVWVGNFGPLQSGSNFEGRLTALAGPNSPLALGDELTPPTGYTVPTAGEQVLLANLQPLYGTGGPECRIPMMRTTGVNVDRAGNVWSCNNWKPDFDIDRTGNPGGDGKGNPGGDGMMIFLGLATPQG